jgi:hypothetical protein
LALALFFLRKAERESFLGFWSFTESIFPFETLSERGNKILYYFSVAFLMIFLFFIFL